MAPGKKPPSIYVIAGTNGAGKSSVAGAAIRERGADYFNPDEATRRILEANPGIDLGRANSQAWLQGKQLLEQAISSRTTFAFETTLGGNTIPALVKRACAAGLALRHDHGSQYMSDHFQKELAFLGIDSSPAFVRSPEGNGCAERFIRTLKENLLWMRTFETIEELRQALFAFRETCNATRLIERHGFLSPAEYRRRQLQPLAQAA